MVSRAGVETGLPVLPSLVVGRISHTRRAPVRHRFTHRVYQWLVDVDDLPDLPRRLRPFATFRAADHIGDPQRSIGENLRSFCAAQGVDVTDHRIVMLANARVLGHTFDPLSVFWAVSPSGEVSCIVAEVHNTYGERHAYLLQPDGAGRTSTDKAFYVSPFFTVAGRYDLRFGLEPDAVTTTIVLRQGPDETDAVFSATFRGAPEPATPRRLVRQLVTKPFMTHRVSLLIRIHGVWLWLRRLPVVPRPTHEPQEGTR